MKKEFCPDLQKYWCVKSISMKSLNEIVISLYEPQAKPESPSIEGRHVYDIFSYPEVFVEDYFTDFYFKDCYYFNIHHEYATHYSENESVEGKTFQRLLKSELLEKQIKSVGDDNLKHYRLVLEEEIIDIITQTKPQIVKKGYS